MLRPMLGFDQDAEGHWVAQLSCGHRQHVRHQPPFTLRPWVVTPEGRAERIGQSLDCPACERREMPVGHVAYKRTPTFTRESIPAALLRRHDTKPGVWGLLLVSSGTLEFFESEADGESRRVVPAGEQAIILPEREHRVAPLGDVEFCVEFWRAAGAAAELPGS